MCVDSAARRLDCSLQKENSHQYLYEDASVSFIRMESDKHDRNNGRQILSEKQYRISLLWYTCIITWRRDKQQNHCGEE